MKINAIVLLTATSAIALGECSYAHAQAPTSVPREKPARPADLIVVETVVSPLQPNLLVRNTVAARTTKTEAEITTQIINNAAAKAVENAAEFTRANANISGTVIDEYREKGQPTGLRVNTGVSQYDLSGAKATGRVPGFGPVKPVSVPMWSVLDF